MEEKEANHENLNSKNKKKKFKFFKSHQVRYITVTAIVLCILLGLSATFILRVYFMTESACYDALAIETEDAIADLEDDLRSDRRMLRVIAGLIGNASDINSLEVSGYLSNYDVNSQITQIGILLPENELILSKGRRVNDDGTLNFSSESIQGEHISGSQSANSNTTTIRSYVPIWKDGICIGLLFSAGSSSSIAKAWIPNVYDKKGYCYVVNRKTGEIIINTTSNQIKMIQDISFIQTDSAYKKEVTVSNILDGKKGYSVFKAEKNSETLYMCYFPFSIEDWEMVVFVPESAVFSAVEPIRNGMYVLMIAVSIIVAIYAVWLGCEIRVSIAHTEQKANIDALTGLQNRNRYEMYLKKIENSKEQLICLFIDVNGLHELNNSKGHFAGDQMLRFIADTLKVQFNGEHIYRIGGDEFVVFESGKTQNEIQQCLVNFDEALQRNNYHAAVGTCVYESGMNVNQLVGNAEKEMYAAKQKYYDKIGKVMRA